MKKVLIILSISLGAGIGWWLGKYSGIMTAYFLSVVGAAGGLYVARRIIKNYM